LERQFKFNLNWSRRKTRDITNGISQYKTIKKLIKIFVATEFFIGIDKPYQSIGGISIFKIN
jgi:hypothetical protein